MPGMLRRAFFRAVATPCLLPLCRLRAANSSLGTIAFIQGGDLWVQTLPDGMPKRLSSGISIESPRFSPSGQWIGCQNKESVYVFRIDGSVQKQFAGELFTWAPTRDVLALSGTDGVRLTDTNGWATSTIIGAGADLPVFSPDGTRCVFSSAVTNGRGPGGEPLRTGQIAEVRLDHPAREPQLLVSKYLTGFLPCMWTADGKSLLYWEDPDFSASIGADGLEMFRVSASGGTAERLGIGTLIHDDMLSLSPAHNMLAAATGGDRETWSGKRIAIVDLDRPALRYLTDENTSALGPSWSPEGKRIAYSAAPDASVEYLKQIGNPATIPVVDSNGQRQTRATPTKIGVGGQQAWPYLAQRRIWTAAAAGGEAARRLTSDDNYRDEEPLWSASGTHILFCRMDRAGNGALWIMNATGDNPVQVSEKLTLKSDRFGYYGYTDWRRSFDWFRS